MDFQKFVDEKNLAATNNNIDWGKRKAEWLSKLEELYSTINNFLNPYTRTGKITINAEVKNLSEQWIGEYQAKALLITIGREQVRLDPIGTLVIGAKGRVDVIGSSGTTRLVLVEKDQEGLRTNLTKQLEKSKKTKSTEIDYVWRISSPPPRITFFPLEEQSFFDVLMKVSNA